MGTERIEELLKLMGAHGLAELELEDGNFKVRLSKAGKAAPVMAAMPQVAAAAPVAAAPAPAAAAKPAADLKQVKSPIVGTFYAAPAPDSPAFAKIGDTVNEDTVVGIIEAMKVMNEVKSGVSGTIAEILVKNGEAVEYGQPLFLVR